VLQAENLGRPARHRTRPNWSGAGDSHPVSGGFSPRSGVVPRRAPERSFPGRPSAVWHDRPGDDAPSPSALGVRFGGTVPSVV